MLKLLYFLVRFLYRALDPPGLEGGLPPEAEDRGGATMGADAAAAAAILAVVRERDRACVAADCAAATERGTGAEKGGIGCAALFVVVVGRDSGANADAAAAAWGGGREAAMARSSGPGAPRPSVAAAIGRWDDVERMDEGAFDCSRSVL